MNKMPKEEYEDLKEELIDKYNESNVDEDELSSLIHDIHRQSWHWGYADAMEESDPYFNMGDEE